MRDAVTNVTTDDAKRFLERYQQCDTLLEYSVQLYTIAVANLTAACAAYGTGLSGQHDPAKKQKSILRAMWLSEKLLESIEIYATHTHEFFCVLAKLERPYELRVLKMRYGDDLEISDIAEKMGMSVRSIHNIKNDGIKSVRVILEEGVREKYRL